MLVLSICDGHAILVLECIHVYLNSFMPWVEILQNGVYPNPDWQSPFRVSDPSYMDREMDTRHECMNVRVRMR